MDRRQRSRLKHYRHRTEKSYVHWIRRVVRFRNRRHPGELGTFEIEALLTHLAVDRKVSVSTQNQAFNALLFLYRVVLALEMPQLDSVTILPKTVIEPLKGYLENVRTIHRRDLKQGLGQVYMQSVLTRKYSRAAVRLRGADRQ